MFVESKSSPRPVPFLVPLIATSSSYCCYTLTTGWARNSVAPSRSPFDYASLDDRGFPEITSAGMLDQTSTEPHGTTASGTRTSGVAPWEARVVSQVPYLSRCPTPPTTNSETPEHQMPRTLRSKSDTLTTSHTPAMDDVRMRSEYNSPIPQSARGIHWTKRRHTSAYIPPQKGLAPYETPLDLPTGAANIRHRSFMGAPNPPLSPPDSPSSCNKSDVSASRDMRSQVLPGTMSSQASTVRGSSRPRSPEAYDCTPMTRSRSEQRPMSKRLTSAFRDIFKKEPLDETGLERISDRHWSEES